MSLYAEVVLGLPLTQTFTYTIPDEVRPLAKVGSRVLVPFHRRQITGFIVGLKRRKREGNYELKDIREVLDEDPVFTDEFLDFARKLSAVSFSSWGDLLQAALPPSYVPKNRIKMSISEEGISALLNETLPEVERDVLELVQRESYTRTFIKRKVKSTDLSTVLLRLERRGWIRAQKEMKRTRRRAEKTGDSIPVQLEMDFSLDKESSLASDFFFDSFGKKGSLSFFLHAPQPNRDAIYFDLIRKMLNARRKVLFLVPEISLTTPFQDKLEKKLGENVAILHSQLTAKQREGEWERIRNGRADVVVGPRSAVLSPLQEIGLIIVDNEHDEAYVQKENPSYDARKGASLRARQSSALLIYGSSAPSVEGYYRAKKKGLLVKIKETPAQRKVEILREHSREGVLGEKLIRRLNQRMTGDAPGPILVFYNRRGYATFTICSRCRHVPRCQRCDVTMSFHKKEGKLLCHYCGFFSSKISICPECGGKMHLGRSFGIEVVEEELKKKFPGKHILSFDSDVIRTHKEQERVLSRFSQKKIDILIGTQFLAHQENLSQVSTVVILYPETLLAIPDFRASQKTFHTLNHMTRFLAREGDPALIIQSSNPDHYSIQHGAWGRYDSFYDQEIRYRRLMNYPPFSYMAEILLTGENLRALGRESRKIFSCVKEQDKEINTWGPALAAPLARIRGKYRVQVVLRSKKKRALDRALLLSLKHVKARKSVFLYE